MRETKQREIGGLGFTVTQIPATRASRLSAKLARTVLPALAKAAKGLEGLDMSKGLGNAKIDLSKLLSNVGDGLDTFFANMSDEDFERIWKELFEFVQVTVPETGRTAPILPVMDDLLAGKMTVFYKLVAFALEVNFQDFFQGLASQSSLMGMAASVLQSKTSGTSATNGSAGVSS